MQKQRSKGADKSKDAELDDLPAATAEGEALKATLDDLLDEIDGVLEQNAEAFVKGYQQRGGE